MDSTIYLAWAVNFIACPSIDSTYRLSDILHPNDLLSLFKFNELPIPIALYIIPPLIV